MFLLVINTEMKQVGCRGDDDPEGVGDRSQTLAMAIEVDPRALPRRAMIEAVLKGGSLEAPRVVQRSAPVSIRIWPVAATAAGAGVGSGYAGVVGKNAGSTDAAG